LLLFIQALEFKDIGIKNRAKLRDCCFGPPIFERFSFKFSPSPYFSPFKGEGRWS